jgi:hypothetical protein
VYNVGKTYMKKLEGLYVGIIKRTFRITRSTPTRIVYQATRMPSLITCCDR